MVWHKFGKMVALELENGKETQYCPSVSLCAHCPSGFPWCWWVDKGIELGGKALGKDLLCSWGMGAERKGRQSATKLGDKLIPNFNGIALKCFIEFFFPTGVH